MYSISIIKRTTVTHPLEKAAIILFLISVTLLVLDKFTSLSINNTTVRFILFYGAVTALPVVMIEYFLGFQKYKTILAVMFSTLIICSLTAFLSWGGDWKTQTVIYRNVKNPSLTIELRMRGDRFAFGYKKQIVKREKILPYLDLIEPVDTSKIDAAEWKFTNEKTNELKLPGDYIALPQK